VLVAIFFSLTLLPGAAPPADAARPIVRLIYFLPSDRPPQPDIHAKLDRLIKDVQAFYADEMERHGYGRKTFAFETDGRGNAVVHRVNALHSDRHYQTKTFYNVNEEISKRFDTARAIYLIVIETNRENLNDGKSCGAGLPNWHYGHIGGAAVIPASGDCFEGAFGVGIAAHELGHAFWLSHDFRNDSYLMSYGVDRTELSACAAEWLSAYRYFNTDTPVFGSPATIRMLPLEVVPPYTVRLRFSVFDPDGLHQAQLLTKATAIDQDPGQFKLIACQSLSGVSGSVDILTREFIGHPRADVTLQVIDVQGNFQFKDYQIAVPAIPELLSVVSIPDTNLAAAIRETLGLQPHAGVTRQHMLRLTRLDAFERRITDLTGLEHAVHLRHLNLHFNQIRDLTPFVDLTNLRDLVLYGNSIGDLTPLAGLTHLTYLDLSGNSIGDLTPLADLTHLSRLHLSGNQITDIRPLAGLTHLSRLYLSRNQIPDVSALAELPQLTTLWIWSNPLNHASINRHIPALRAKGIDVKLKNPPGHPAAPKQTVRPPKSTHLLVNYPNPFNPETWIPYQLAEPADVSRTIYGIDGQVVRHLDVGCQPAGVYQTRSRAAYWDGRNAVGEPVASGIYFYTLTTGDFTATRKLLIRK